MLLNFMVKFYNIIRAIKDPAFALTYFTKKKYLWKNKNNIETKDYNTYEEYLKHQREKIPDPKLLKKYDIKYREELKNRLINDKIIKSSSSVLCLAARIGTEVKAFIDIGCFAVGIDIKPGEKNKYVVLGDFHNIQYSNNSLDVIFSNSLDHAFNINKIVKESKRVLKKNGVFILEIIKGNKEGAMPGYYEACYWEKIDDVIKLFKKENFKIIKRNNIKSKNRECIYLKINK